MFSCLSRFLFLLLGPFGKGPQYHEIGRSMATLMTDEVRQQRDQFSRDTLRDAKLLIKKTNTAGAEGLM